jgi:dihydropteroate synthase
MVGPSRKRFIGDIGANGGGPLPPAARLEGTVGACVAALFGGAMLFRVHDVQAVRRALDVAHEVRKVAT